MTPKLRTLLWLVAVVVPLDQLTKHWVSTNIPYGGHIQVIEGFFRITHARNPGAALGIAQNAPIWLFIALTIAALAMIGSFFRKVPAHDRFSAFALGLIVSGALGNLIDRVWHHEVIDFLQFDLQLFIFPDFNVADSAIVIGVALLLLDVVTQETERSVAGPPGPDLPSQGKTPS
jgi:signal peptidase II